MLLCLGSEGRATPGCGREVEDERESKEEKWGVRKKKRVEYFLVRLKEKARVRKTERNYEREGEIVSPKEKET